jgi:hypothetical protein
MRLGRAALLLLAGFLGGAAACVLGPDERLSCGDAYVSDAEECDPADPEQAYLDACRARGFAKNADCHPDDCRILADDEQCNACGDGIAADGEECDGEDLRGETCPNGQDELRCTDDCRLDYDDCPQSCGDGVVTDDEECDLAAYCDNADDCRNGTFCNGTLCVHLADDELPIDACTDLQQTFVVGKKQFTSGEIYDCRPTDCRLSREQCSFCGDGVLDVELEIKPPTGADSIPIPPEFCDGNAISDDDLAAWCLPLCSDPEDDPPEDRRMRCHFECKDDCTSFDSNELDPDFLDPDFDRGCCLMKGEPCVIGEELQCCDVANQGSVSLGTCKSPGDGLAAVCH